MHLSHILHIHNDEQLLAEVTEQYTESLSILAKVEELSKQKTLKRRLRSGLLTDSCPPSTLE